MVEQHQIGVLPKSGRVLSTTKYENKMNGDEGEWSSSNGITEKKRKT